MEKISLPINYDQAHWTTRRQARNQYIIEQKNLCYFCKKSLFEQPTRKIRKAFIDKTLFPPNFFQWPIHLHHDHTTKLTIGAVHARCNAFLWQYNNQ